LSERLGRVGVDEHAAFAGDGGDFADRLERADLVVGVHDAYERGAPIDGLADGVGIDEAVAVHGQDGDAAAQALEELARLQGGGVVHRAGDDVRVPGAAAPAAPR